jgi:hypothetical protein
MDPDTKTIQRESLLDLIDASRAQTVKPQHAHVVRRARVRRRELGREPSALRGLVIVLLFVLAMRSLVLWIF